MVLFLDSLPIIWGFLRQGISGTARDCSNCNSEKESENTNMQNEYLALNARICADSFIYKKYFGLLGQLEYIISSSLRQKEYH